MPQIGGGSIHLNYAVAKYVMVTDDEVPFGLSCSTFVELTTEMQVSRVELARGLETIPVQDRE